MPITTKVFDTLLALVRRRGELVTKDELISEVWPLTVVSEDSLTQNISALRRLLEDDAAQPQFIATVARRGYRFIAKVSSELDVVPSGSRPQGIPALPPESASASSQAAPPASIPVRAESPAALRVAGRWRISRILGGILLLVGGVAFGIFVSSRLNSDSPQERRLRFVPELPPESTLASGGVVSPDARHVVFVARDRRSGETKLWLRTLSTGAAHALSGSEGASRPFWSPDSQSVAFFAGSRIRRVTLAGDAPIVVCNTIIPRPIGGSWNEQGDILFADANALFMVPASGGEPRVIREPSPADKELAVAWPQFLPGGETFLYEVTSADPGRTGIYVGSLNESSKNMILDVAGSQVSYTKGYLLYVRDRRLFARAFAPESSRFTGDPFVVVDETSPNASVSAARESVITFGGGASEDVGEFDRNGKALRIHAGAPPLRNLTLSPDQRTLIGDAIDPSPGGIWIIDLDRQVSSRLLANGAWPLWLPDGRRVAFTTATRDARPTGLYLHDMESGTDQLLFPTSTRPIVSDASADGRTIAYTAVVGSTTLQDIWIAPVEEGATPSRLIATTAREIHPAISPDGRWIAYSSDEDGGTFNVYIDAFPALGQKKRISMNGGTQPQWRADGKELFYVRADQTIMSVGVTTTSSAGPELTAARPLFRPMLFGLMSDFRNQYTVGADGNTFYVGIASAESAREPISLIVNWRGSTE